MHSTPSALVAAAWLAVVAPAPASAAPPAPVAAAAPAPSPVLRDFMAANRVDGVLDAWLQQMKVQWDEQVRYMKVKPPAGFWEAAVKEFDMAAERRELGNVVASGMSQDEMKADVAWLTSSGVGNMNVKLDALHAAAEPIQAGLVAEARRAVARNGGPAGPSSPPAPARPAPPSLAPAELAKVSRLMDALGYGARDVLETRLVESMKSSMPAAPAGTWSDAQFMAAASDAAAGIEAAFIKTWTPSEAAALADALGTPDAKRHDDLMSRLTTLVMARSEPFAKAFQTHLLKRYGKIYGAAWEEHQRQQ